MKRYLTSYVSHQQEDWGTFLSMAEFAANNHVSNSMGASPFLANHGHHARMDYTVASPQGAGPSIPLIDFVARMTKADDHLCAEMRFAQDKEEQHANASCPSAPRMAVGNQV